MLYHGEILMSVRYKPPSHTQHPQHPQHSAQYAHPPTPSFGVLTKKTTSGYSQHEDPHVLNATNAHLQTKIDGLNAAIAQMREQLLRTEQTHQRMLDDMQSRHAAQLSNIMEKFHMVSQVLRQRLEISPEEQHILAQLDSNKPYMGNGSSSTPY